MEHKKRLKIGIFMDNFYPSIDGVVVVIDNLASMLAKFNDVTVVVPNTESHNEDYKRPYDVIRITSVKMPLTEYKVGLPRAKMTKEYKKLIKKDFDIVHIHSPFTMGKLGLKLARQMNIPCICTVHTRFDLEVAKMVKSKVITKGVMKSIIKTFNDCDNCIVVNDPVIDDIKSFGYKNKATIIYNGTDLEPLKEKEKYIKMINKLYDLKEKDRVLVFVGRITSVKNIFFLLKSLKLLKEDGVKYKMLFVGSGPDEKKLKSKIKSYKLQDCVQMTERISDRILLSAIYARADLLLFPSLMDTSSLVRIEAAVNETPGLFIDNSMVGVTIQDNINGFLSPLDETKYKDRIKEIINNKKLLKKVSKKARETLGKSWKTIADETYEEYLKTIENKR
ncbi:MAG: glycosyltransferase [Bacilli bacterium]|nr:glycosyltransferase [Bacilli bacterium]